MSNPFKPLRNILDNLKRGKKPVQEPQTPLNVNDVPTTIMQTPQYDDELSNRSDTDEEYDLDQESQNIEGALFAEDQYPRRTNQSVHPNAKPIQTDLKLFQQELKDESNTRQILTVLNKNDGLDVEASNLTELSDNIRLSVLNKTHADVAIRVGPNHQIIHAHKIILASRSSYFYQLFSQKVDLVDKSSGMIKLELSHIIAEPFLKVLEFIYTGVARLKQDDVLEVLALSEEFGIPTLKEMCSEYIQESVDVENSCMLLELAREYNCKSLESYCYQFIDKSIQRVLSTKGFEDLSEATLLQIISRDELELSAEEEIDVFHAVYRWTKNRYLTYSREKNCAPDHANKELQEISKNVIIHVRFPLMTSDQISSIVEPKNFVPKDLCYEAYRFHVMKKDGKDSSQHPSGQRFSVRGIKKKNNKSFITTRGALTPIKRDSLGKRQGSFVIEKSDSPFTSPLKKVHFEPAPFSQETPVRRIDVDDDVAHVVATPGSIYFNI